MNRRTILLLTVTVSIIAIATVAATSTRKPVSTVQPRVDTVQHNPARAVDGATNPELIPDHVAYSLLFRLIANRNTVEEQHRIRAYIEQMGLEGADVDALIAAAEEFNQRVNTLDSQAATIRDRNFYTDAEGNPQPKGTAPSAEEHARLKQLQGQKQSLVTQITASLQNRLSVNGLMRVRQHVNERVKSKVRMSMRQQ